MQSPPPRREPIFNLPGVVLATLLVLVAVHALRVFLLSDETDLELLIDLAVVPARWSVALDPGRLSEVLRAAGSGGSEAEIAARTALARYVLAEGGPHSWTAATYALLHGSWTHLLLNGVWLAAFGTPVARRLGRLRFLALGLACALGGALAHALVHPLGVVPMIGASAVVSGLMAAAARFVFSPPLARPLQSLPELLGNRRAALFLGTWFLINLAVGLVATPLGVADAGIAWEAHIGGFAVGLCLFPLLDRFSRANRAERSG